MTNSERRNTAPHRRSVDPLELKRREDRKEEIPALFFSGLNEAGIALQLQLPISLVETYIQVHQLKKKRREQNPDRTPRLNGAFEKAFDTWSDRVVELRNDGWTVPMITKEIGIPIRQVEEIVSRLLAQGRITSNRSRRYPPSLAVLIRKKRA